MTDNASQPSPPKARIGAAVLAAAQQTLKQGAAPKDGKKDK